MFIPLVYDHGTNTVHIQTPAGMIVLPFEFAQDMFIQGAAFTIGVTRRIAAENDDVVADVERFLNNEDS